MYREFSGRKPAEGPHRKVVRAAVVNSKLICKVIQGVKAFLVLPMAAFHLAVVPGRVWADELVADPQFAAVVSKRVSRSRLLLEKRLVNSKPLSV